MVHPQVKEYLSRIGKRGGSVKSERKTQQNRLNGMKRKVKKVVDEAKPLGLGYEE